MQTNVLSYKQLNSSACRMVLLTTQQEHQRVLRRGKLAAFWNMAKSFFAKPREPSNAYDLLAKFLEADVLTPEQQDLQGLLDGDGGETVFVYSQDLDAEDIHQALKKDLHKTLPLFLLKIIPARTLRETNQKIYYELLKLCGERKIKRVILASNLFSFFYSEKGSFIGERDFCRDLGRALSSIPPNQLPQIIFNWKTGLNGLGFFNEDSYTHTIYLRSDIRNLYRSSAYGEGLILKRTYLRKEDFVDELEFYGPNPHLEGQIR